MSCVKLCLRVLGLGIVLFVMGCSTGKIVKTYSGEVLPNSEVAVLTAPENISLLSVNGVAVQQYLLSGIETNYGLKVGENLVTFQYESVWGKAKRAADESRSEAVSSEPNEVMIKAKAGEKYIFSYIKPLDVREAKKIADDFTANIYDQNNDLVAVSAEKGSYAKMLVAKKKKAIEEVVSVNSMPLGGEGSLAESPSDLLDHMKKMWGLATPQQKKAFLVWAFQE